jgi:hypothetical protein
MLKRMISLGVLTARDARPGLTKSFQSQCDAPLIRVWQAKKSSKGHIGFVVGCLGWWIYGSCDLAPSPFPTAIARFRHRHSNMPVGRFRR